MQRDKMPNRDIATIETNHDDETWVMQVFDKHHHLIKNNATLNVKTGEEAFFCEDGKIADHFLPGEYVLNEKSLPILSALQGWKYDSNNPFESDICFVNTQQFSEQSWAAQSFVPDSDSIPERIDVSLSGIFSFQIIKAEVFVRKYIATEQKKDSFYVSEKIGDYLSSSLSAILQDANVEPEFLYRELGKVSEIVLESLNRSFQEEGINLLSFQIVNVSVDSAVVVNEDGTVIVENTEIVDLEKLARIKAEKEASETDKSVGFEAVNSGIINQKLLDVIAKDNLEVIEHSPQNELIVEEDIDSEIVIPSVSYYVAIDNKQAGPFENAILIQLFLDGKLTKGSLVWTKGLSNWVIAESRDDLNFVWETSIPPLPEN